MSFLDVRERDLFMGRASLMFSLSGKILCLLLGQEKVQKPGHSGHLNSFRAENQAAQGCFLNITARIPISLFLQVHFSKHTISGSLMGHPGQMRWSSCMPLGLNVLTEH